MNVFVIKVLSDLITGLIVNLHVSFKTYFYISS